MVGGCGVGTGAVENQCTAGGPWVVTHPLDKLCEEELCGLAAGLQQRADGEGLIGKAL